MRAMYESAATCDPAERLFFLRASKIIMNCLYVIASLALMIGLDIPASAQLFRKAVRPVGDLFAKKQYTPQPLPTFEQSKDKLPNPILDDNPDWVEMYWKCWQIAFTNIHQPKPGSVFVSNWIDAAFKDYIYQWDTIFMVMFARYGDGTGFPGAQSLDNFYCRQHQTGYICAKSTGRRFGAAGGRSGKHDQSAAVQLGGGGGVQAQWRQIAFRDGFAVLEKYVEWLNRDGDRRPPTAPTGKTLAAVPRVSAPVVLEHRTGLGMDNTPRRGNGWSICPARWSSNTTISRRWRMR